MIYVACWQTFCCITTLRAYSHRDTTQYNNNKEIDLMNIRQSKVLKQFKIQTVFYRMF